jgi:hypothetical protein
MLKSFKEVQEQSSAALAVIMILTNASGSGPIYLLKGWEK